MPNRPDYFPTADFKPRVWRLVLCAALGTLALVLLAINVRLCVIIRSLSIGPDPGLAMISGVFSSLTVAPCVWGVGALRRWKLRGILCVVLITMLAPIVASESVCLTQEAALWIRYGYRPPNTIVVQRWWPNEGSSIVISPQVGWYATD
jgi:hypothetical protein